MAIHPLRRLFQYVGIDIRAHRPKKDAWDWIATLPIKTVLDIGANTGQFLDEIHPLFPDATLYAFEPVSAPFARLKERATSNPKLHIFNCAIGDTTEELPVTVNSYSPSSSLLPLAEGHLHAFPNAVPEKTERIKVRRLDDVLAGETFETPLLINIDVQGYEHKVIEGGENTLSKATAVILESSFKRMYEGQKLFADLHAQMARLGFFYYGALRQKNDTSGEPLFEDSLFVKH